MKKTLMRRVSRSGLLLAAATATGCMYPALKTGTGGNSAATGTQASGGTHAGGTVAGATGSGGNGGGDAGVRDAPVSQSDVPAGGQGGGGTSTGGSSSGAGPNCPALKDPSNGSVSASPTTRGSTAVYSCNTGFNLSGSKTSTCQADGTWSVAAPTCTIVDCGALTKPANGSVTTSKTTYGSTADYTCNSGFGLAGTSPRICQADGNWSGTTPSCGLADCPDPPSIPNGAPTTTGTTFGSTATYACNPGYKLSDTTAHTCQSDRTWSGNPPTCTVVDCGTPSIASGFVSQTGTTYNSTATYTCTNCFSMTGDAKRTCQADGTWSGVQPTCTLADCGMPPDPANGKANLNGGTTCPWSATYSCNTGYSLSTTTKTRTCQSDGTWSTPAPACSTQMLDVTVTMAGNGTGKVTSTDGKISCPGTCVVTYPYGSIIVITATPDANLIFSGWGGGGCTGQGSCQVNITSAEYVTATFSQPPNIMFTTSTTQTAASLGGLAGADALCMRLAAKAMLSGTYKAWLSTKTMNASSRLGTATGWVRTDGKPVFNSPNDIINNRIFYPPRLDESKNDLGLTLDPLLMPEILVITNTSTRGAMPDWGTYGTCGDFTSNDGTTILRGSASHNGSYLTQAADLTCSVPARLYCFGVDHQTQVVVTPAVGRYAFVAEGAWAPGSGIGSADTLCQNEASAANLPGNYLALLAQTGLTAASRFDYATGTLPWIRTDGIMIAPTANAFFTTPLFDASPNVSADGSFNFGFSGVWSGAPSPTTPGTEATNCTNWYSSNPGVYGWAGAASDSSTRGFFDHFEQTSISECSYTGTNVLCLQK